MSKIIHGECISELKKMKDNSIDLVCTDPPYGYSFMGKDWDKAVPSVEIWQECLRVLKPGAFCLVMSAPRSDVQNAMISRLMDAGFRLDFTPIYWTYASGFPKAGNIGKMVDKRGGVQNSDYWGLARYLKVQRDKLGYTKSQMDEACGIKSSYYKWEGAQDGDLRIPAKVHYLILKDKLHLDSRYDGLVERIEAERVIVGKRNSNALDQHKWLSENYDNHQANEVDITIPKTDQAKALDGSYAGFQPKPAVEVIIIAMKPLSEKTYVDQALANGKGISWLDDARIPTEGFDKDLNRERNNKPKDGIYELGIDKKFTHIPANTTGRFPANLLVSDDVLNDGSNHHSSGNYKRGSDGGAWHGTDLQHKAGEKVADYGDKGSYSRYFDLDKWASTLPFLIVPKASKREKNEGLGHLGDKEKYSDYGLSKRVEGGVETNERTNREASASKNHHPTVKPLKLMSYLITLGSRGGDIVLDPFVGSGTTVIAAEKLGRNGVGIEREAEYVEIAQARLDSVDQHRQVELL